MPVAWTEELVAATTEPSQTNPPSADVATVNEEHWRRGLSCHCHCHRRFSTIGISIGTFPLFGRLYENNFAGPGRELRWRWLWWRLLRLWLWYLGGWWWR